MLGYMPPRPATNVTLLQPLVVSDGALLTTAGVPSTKEARSKVFLELYSAVVPLLLPDPATVVRQDRGADAWGRLASRSAADLLLDASATLVNGSRLLRAYYNDSRAGLAEFVTQLDVLAPLRRWNRSHPLHHSLTAALHSTSFYHAEIGSVADTLSSPPFAPGQQLDGWSSPLPCRAVPRRKL